MTGQLIQFERRRDLRRGQLFRQQSVPRGPAPAAGSGTGIVELRIARINRLLSELEELTRLLQGVPPATLDQARGRVEKARRIVRPRTVAEADLEGTPQPELDDERIERMYRELNTDL